MKQDKITIHGPKIDGTYIVEFKNGRRCGARVLSAKGGRDCRPGVLPRQDALRACGAGCPTDHFKSLLLAKSPLASAPTRHGTPAGDGRGASSMGRHAHFSRRMGA